MRVGEFEFNRRELAEAILYRLWHRLFGRGSQGGSGAGGREGQ